MKLSKKFLFALCALWMLAFYVGCEKDTDGPLSATSGSEEFDGEGFFLASTLDSGSVIHLVQDTLYVGLGKIWSFSNCALQRIQLNSVRSDSTLWIRPKIIIHTTDEDCAAPYYRPDTVLKVVINKDDLSGIAMIKIANDMDSVLDSILVRRGSLSLDTFFVYMDSSFSDVHNYPLRTKDKKKSARVPMILRMLDSLTPRTFYWRTMKSTCTHRVDKCESTVADTVYPTSWNISDTNLVPVHYACADTDSIYCINSKWENDSTSLGQLQERPDTIWHYSTYYMEKIPKCGAYNSFAINYYSVGSRVRFIRELLDPDSAETFCGPSTGEEWMVYDLTASTMVSDTTQKLDSLLAVLDTATVAPDTLIVEEDD